MFIVSGMEGSNFLGVPTFCPGLKVCLRFTPLATTNTSNTPSRLISKDFMYFLVLLEVYLDSKINSVELMK